MNKKILCIMLSSLFLFGCDSQNDSQQKERPATQVEVKKVEKQKITLTNELNGRTVATKISDIRPQISGVINRKNFEEGDYVNKDQILYEIDPSTYRSNYNKAVADLRVQESNLRSARLKSERYKALLKTNNVSKQEAEDVNALYSQTLANIESSKANVESAKIDLERTKIKAPISGYIGISNFTEGALVTANQTDSLATIRDLDNIYVDLTQNSHDALNFREKNIKDGKLNNDENIKLILENDKEYQHMGKVLLSDYNVNENTGTVTLRTVFDNKNHILLPGMFVKAIIPQEEYNDIFLIPEESILRNKNGEPYVFVSKDGIVVVQPVTLINKNENNEYIISDGLSDNDLVIISNLNKVQSGQKITHNNDIKK